MGAQYFQTNVEASQESLSKGKLSVIPITISIQGRFPTKSHITPYILAGGSYYFNKFYLDNEIISSWNGIGFDIAEKVENSMGFHFGAGIDFFIIENIALNIDARYYIAESKGIWTLADQVSNTEISGDLEKLNLNSIIFGVGLKLYFWRSRGE